MEEVAALEEIREEIVAEEEDRLAEEDEEEEEENDDGMTAEEKLAACKGTMDNYTSEVASRQKELNEINALTTKMADGLAEIDPNTENADEGKAFMKKMYKLRGITFDDTSVIMPETPEMCVELVAGKVLQVENLQDDIDSAASFNSFFADVYCSAYVNSLVTMKDGLYQIFPGGLDYQIEDEIQRVYGPFESTELDMKEMDAIMAYMEAIDNGSFERDESILIEKAEPLTEAMALCKDGVQGEMEEALEDREDYLNDYNFLRFLQSQ